MKLKNYLSITAILYLLLSASYSKAQRFDPHNAYIIKADSLLHLFTQMSPFAVLDMVSTISIDHYDCYHNKEIKHHLLNWLDKELYFEYNMQNSLEIAFSDGEVKKNKVKGWLIRNNKRELIDTILSNPKLYAIYLDTVISQYIQYHKHDFFSHGAKLPNEILSFFGRYRVPESYDILYSYWEEDGKIRRSPYYPPLLAMHDPEALKIANNHIDSLIETGDAGNITNVLRWYGSPIYGKYSVDWRTKLLYVTVERNLYDFDDSTPFSVPFNIYLLSPFNNRYLLPTDTEVVIAIINSLFEPMERIESLSREEINNISKKIINNIHEFEKAGQPYREKLLEENRYWKDHMPYKQ
jgi:hypothetical protein